MATKAEAPIRTYYRRWKVSAIALESREQESLNRNTEFIAVQGQEEEQHYYEAMHQDDYKIQDDMQDTLAYLASSDMDTIYFDQEMKQPDRKEFLSTAIREINIHCKLKHWNSFRATRSPRENLSLTLSGQ